MDNVLFFACKRALHTHTPPLRRQGVEAALLSRGTTVPLSPLENIFSQCVGASNVNNSFGKLKPVRTPGSANQHTYSAFMATLNLFQIIVMMILRILFQKVYFSQFLSLAFLSLFMHSGCCLISFIHLLSFFYILVDLKPASAFA